jgi:hypothetical protein
MRVNRGREFVVGGYTVGTNTLDALVFGHYDGDRLIYAGRTRNGFTPIMRKQLFRKFRALEIKECPFVNLPEAKSGRWGAGLNAAKMKDCRWLKPLLVRRSIVSDGLRIIAFATRSLSHSVTISRLIRLNASSGPTTLPKPDCVLDVSEGALADEHDELLRCARHR